MRNVYFLIQLGTNSINLKAIRDRIPEKRFNLPHRNLHYRLSNDKTKAIAQLDMTEAEIVFVNSKAWASPSGAMYAPTPAVYQAWCEEMASHYDGKISLFELGNEPNFNIFWPAGPSAADYVALLSAGYTGIKAGNADALVISAAPGNKFATDGAGIQTFTFFTDMYTAGLKSCSDIIALHPYADAVYDGTTTNNFSRLNTMRNIMISNGDLNKRVILSELGWSTYTGGVTEAQQAANIKTFYNSIMFGDYKYIDIISFYNFQNAGTDAANTEHNYGLVTNDFTPKPAYASYTEMKNQYNGVFTESAL